MGEDRKKERREKRYIRKRKIEAFLHGLTFYACRIFPVDEKKIVMWTFEGGGGYGCSPRYIARELLKRNRERGTGYRICWLVDDMERKFPKGIRKVRNTLWSRAYHMSTAGIWVGNSRTAYGTKKRKGQRYIQTWHATICIKPIGKYRGDRFPKMAYLVSAYDSGLTDCVLSGSAWCDHMYRKGLLYDGEIIRTGTPRCDVLLKEKGQKRRQLRRACGMPEDARILLYAPTFRGGSQGVERSVDKRETAVDLERLMGVLEERFGGRWYICLRLHPQLASLMDWTVQGPAADRIVDVSRRTDMNEIIAGCDAFLTDYSSAVFEAAMAGLPGFLYVDDLEEYVADRGDLFFDMRELPFPVATDNDGLMEDIRGFQEEEYQEKVREFMKEMGACEDGHASKRVGDLIERWARK